MKNKIMRNHRRLVGMVGEIKALLIVRVHLMMKTDRLLEYFLKSKIFLIKKMTQILKMISKIISAKLVKLKRKNL